MPISKDEVLKVGLLSRIRLKPDEVERFASQLSAILDYVGKLGELETEDVEPLAHALPIRNVLRQDEPRQGLSTGEAVAGAPDKVDEFFRVPRVLDEDAGA